VSVVEVRVPDLGDFESVDVIEVHIKPGDPVSAEDPLITLETDKATMDVPSPQAGTVESVTARVGTKIAAGDVIVTLQQTAPPKSAQGSPDDAASRNPATGNGRASRLAVLGAGPGGYTAAFRAADLGLDVTLVERYPTLGGVCLNVGCIPSKALLHAARVIEDAQAMGEHGIAFSLPEIDTVKLVAWKDGVVQKLTKGLEGLAKQRKVRVIRGTARFVSARQLEIDRDGERELLDFDQCIVAAGSEPSMLPNLPNDRRIMSSTAALDLAELPERLLVVGGGIIGLEMATVYDALGVKVSVVELTKTLIPGCDRDLVKPLEKRISSRYEAIMLGTRVVKIEAQESGIAVQFQGDQVPAEAQVYGRVLVAVGRSSNGRKIGAERAGIDVDQRGFIRVDQQMRTNVSHIFAIGDIVGQPMLAHKASHEGKVAAEAAAGQKSFFDARVVPSVAYTDPEVAWVGLTEDEAKTKGIAYEKGTFLWAASARSLTLGRSDGLTKLLFDKSTGRLLGAGIVGTNAGDLIAEAALAIEMGCNAEDVALTVHPHPTLSETLAFAAEAAEGTITDLYVPRKRP
jgi:dihydrolipoamide dehydrogenase